MFTGIIQSIAKVENINHKDSTYIFKTNLNLSDCKVGSSICCDGICLTVINLTKIEEGYTFSVNVGEETIKRTNIINWKLKTKINIEKSLKMGDEIAGHFVYGHIDSCIEVAKIIKSENSWEFEFIFSKLNNLIDFDKYIVEKGSITINGISLTIANVFEYSFTVSVIPYTFINTNLSILQEGDKVNIEFDPLARYISKKYAK